MDKVFVTDVDGVLLDYNDAYIRLWFDHFGVMPSIKNKDGYHALDKYDIERLPEGPVLREFLARRDENFWKNMHPIMGAKEMLTAVKQAGFTVIALSAAAPRNAKPRADNLAKVFGNLIDISMCVGYTPKCQTLNAIGAKELFFIDDFCDYFKGINRDTVTTILYDRNSGIHSPNYGVDEANFSYIIKDLGEVSNLL